MCTTHDMSKIKVLIRHECLVLCLNMTEPPTPPPVARGSVLWLSLYKNWGWFFFLLLIHLDLGEWWRWLKSPLISAIRSHPLLEVIKLQCMCIFLWIIWLICWLAVWLHTIPEVFPSVWVSKILVVYWSLSFSVLHSYILWKELANQAC